MEVSWAALHNELNCRLSSFSKAQTLKELEVLDLSTVCRALADPVKACSTVRDIPSLDGDAVPSVSISRAACLQLRKVPAHATSKSPKGLLTRPDALFLLWTLGCLSCDLVVASLALSLSLSLVASLRA